MRVLLVRFSAIGDCVMAAWAATAVELGGHEVTWAVEGRCAPVVAFDAHVFPRDVWKKRRGSPAVFADQLRTYLGLRRHAFDVGVDLQGHSKTALCLRLSGARSRLAVGATDALAARLNPLANVPTGRHTVERNAVVLAAAGLPGEIPALPRLPVARRTPEPGLVTIAVSAGQPEKAYPLEGWAEVARALLARGKRVEFLGGPGDRAPDVPGTADLVGRLPLGETMARVAAAEAVLAADTGAGHLAAALGVPVVSAFGPTDPAVFRPYTNRGVVLRPFPTPAEIVAAMEGLA